MSGTEAIAVVGMACVFPGAASVTRFWHNICAGIDSTSEPPPGRIDPVFRQLHGARRIDRFRCWRGGFIDAHARFDAPAHGMPPIAVETAEPEQLLALGIAADALADAGYDRELPCAARTSVIVGRGNYTSSARMRFEQAIRGAEQLVRILEVLLPEADSHTVESIREQFQAQLAAPEREAVINLVPNLTAARIAERFNLGGPAYTIDAACASSLVAVDHACASLREGSSDLALAGGVHLCHSVDFWGVFNQIDLLSHEGVSRPLDRRADGLLIGEGVGFVVLKRAADAVRAGDRTYALIAGSGSSSDGRGTSPVRPNRDGQLLALTRAWQASGHQPAELRLLEAHATGTQIGDAVEVETIARFFAGRAAAPVSLGSVKSMIGHAMPAAGMAGLIKTVLAIHHGVLPPSLHCEQPRAELIEAGFNVHASAHAWEGRRRVAAVNAFGFGGTNAHVVVTGSGQRSSTRSGGARRAHALPCVARYSADTPAALADSVRRDERGERGRLRAVVLNPTLDAREQFAQHLNERKPRTLQPGVFYSERALLAHGGRISCVFPGFDAGPPPSLDELAAWLGEAAPSPPRDTTLEAQGRAILESNGLILRALSRLGIECDVFAGHSVGEWNAMLAAGICDDADIRVLIDALEPGTVGTNDGAFVALGTSARHASDLLAGREDAVVSHDNCPHQCVIACPARSAHELVEHLSSHGVICQVLPFGSGVHSRFFAPHLARSTGRLAGLPLRSARCAVYSATTCAPYPAEPEAIRDVITRHMLEPVRFRALVERLYADGARVFLQAGAGPTAAFVADTLRGREHVALSAHVRDQSALLQLLRVACAVWVEGGNVAWHSLKDIAPDAPCDRARVLQLGVPLVSLPRRLQARAASTAPSTASPASELAAIADANLMRIARVQREVADAVAVRSRPSPAETSVLRWRFDLAAQPEFVDHAFYRQPAGWPDIRDRYPVVPMTALLEVLAAAAVEHHHEQHVVALHDVWAKRWLNVSEPVDATVRSSRIGETGLLLKLDDYAEGRVEVADAFPAAVRFVPFDLRNARPCPVDATALYSHRWMFHGAAYHSVAEIGSIADDGIEGVITAKDGPGSLLDAAGQLLGLWLMLSRDRDRFAMPVRIRRLRYFGVAPARGQRLRCSIRISEITDSRLVADLRVGDEVGLYVDITGWEDRRFPTDEALWSLLRWPEETFVCEVHDGQARIPLKRYESAHAYEMLAARYCAFAERAALSRLPANARWPGLLAHIAVKDAVRTHRRNRTGKPGYPIELAVQMGEGSRCRVEDADGWIFEVDVTNHGGDVRAEVIDIREPGKGESQ